MRCAAIRAIIDLVSTVDAVTTDAHTKILLRIAYQLLKALYDEVLSDETA